MGSNVEFMTEDGSLVCVICYDKIGETNTEGQRESPVQLECQHLFGNICLDKWLSKKRKCPICRSEVKMDAGSSSQSSDDSLSDSDSNEDEDMEGSDDGSQDMSDEGSDNFDESDSEMGENSDETDTDDESGSEDEIPRASPDPTITPLPPNVTTRINLARNMADSINHAVRVSMVAAGFESWLEDDSMDDSDD